jgi:hypothetical protein
VPSHTLPAIRFYRITAQDLLATRRRVSIPGTVGSTSYLPETQLAFAAHVVKSAARLVDVRNVGNIHVAAMLDETADGRRLFAAPHKFTLNKILAWRQASPSQKNRRQCCV